MNKIREFFSKRIETVKSALKKFPVTIILIFISTIIITFEKEIFSNEIFDHISCILFFTLLGTLLVETLFIKDKKKYFGIALSFFIGILFDKFIKSDITDLNTIIRWIFAYIIFSLLLSLYYLSKKSDKFEKYVLNTFLNLKNNTIIYGIVCLGILMLYGIFCVLINDLDFDIIYKIISLFTGFYFAPVILDSFTNKEIEDTKFNKTIFSRVLLILLCFAMLIVYIYIFKLLFVTGIPENQVFTILALIFVFLFPICVINKNYCEEDKFLNKVIKILPVLFIPFIILQMYTMGIRISNYGITEQRYFAIVFMILEATSIVMLLYKDSKYLRKLILVTILISMVELISPINSEKISILSQESTVKKFANLNTKFDNLEIEEQRKYAGAYKYLNDIEGYNFKVQIDTLEKEKLESFDNYHNRTRSYDDVLYYSYDAKLQDLDISEYSKIEEVSRYISNYDESKENEEVLKTYIELDDHQIEVDVDLNELVSKLIENYKISSETSKRIFEENNLLIIDNNRDLYITSLDLDFTEEKIKSVSLQGYVLER